MLSDEEFNAIVIDNGSAVIRSGLAGDDLPACSHTLKADENPFENGIVSNWQRMGIIWSEVFRKNLNSDGNCEKNPVLLTEPLANSRSIRERITQILFEEFSAPAVFIQSEEVLSMYASGAVTGLVLHSGESWTNAVPIYEGFLLNEGIGFEVAGKHVTEYLRMLLNAKETLSIENLRDIKKKFISVSVDREIENEAVYELPDGTRVELNNRVITCGDVLFEPSMLGLDMCGIDELCFRTANKCDVDLRRDLLNNVVLAGGNSMVKGLKERLEAAMCGKGTVVGNGKREFYPWIGGSIVGSLSNYKGMWMWKSEYEERGPSLVNVKCRK